MAIYTLEPILHSCSEMAESGGTGGDTQLDSSAEVYRELPVDVEGLDEADAGRGRKKKGDSRIIDNGMYISLLFWDSRMTHGNQLSRDFVLWGPNSGRHMQAARVPVGFQLGKQGYAPLHTSRWRACAGTVIGMLLARCW